MSEITPAHLHLLINHAPVFGSMAAVLLLLWGLVRNNAEVKRVALITFVIVGVTAFMSDQTGGGAAAVARHMPGVGREAIKAHAKAAGSAALVSEIGAGIALIGLIVASRRKDAGTTQSALDYTRHHKEPHMGFVIVCLVAGLIQVYLMGVTAYLGGAVRHPEIEPGFVVPAYDSTQSAPAKP